MHINLEFLCIKQKQNKNNYLCNCHSGILPYSLCGIIFFNA